MSRGAQAPSGNGYAIATQLFLRSLGVVYAIAFGSFWAQIDRLIGSRGIAPAEELLPFAWNRLGGEEALLRFPTLFWIHVSDGALHATCAIGVIAGLLVAAGVLQKPLLGLLWALYLSLVNVSDPFLSLQWDALLLETGFVSIFLPRWRAFCPPLDPDEPARLVRWCLYFLLFRLMFASGMVKLLGGDPTWLSFSALEYHYETQPLPTVLGWYAHQLPSWAHAVSTGAMFLIELVVPWLVWGPAPVRRAAFVPLVGLQLLIALTGNYGFFNLLAIALCLPLLDDALLRRWIPRRWRERFDDRIEIPMSTARKTLAVLVAIPILALSSFGLIASLVGFHELPDAIRRPARRVAAWNTFNPYGLFAVMTTDRPEIVFEGSDDGRQWKEYELRWKPGDVHEAPRWCAPHMPRVDWQLWFAALGSANTHPWVTRFMDRVLEGRPEALEAFGKDPFHGRPPRLLRARLYVYRMTSFSERDASEGAYWKRTDVGMYAEARTRR